MRFVNDEVQTIRLVLDGVVQRFPDGILPIVRMLCQFTAAADLLSVEEVYVTVLQHLHVKGIFHNSYALTEAQLAGFEFDFLF